MVLKSRRGVFGRGSIGVGGRGIVVGRKHGRGHEAPFIFVISVRVGVVGGRKRHGVAGGYLMVVSQSKWESTKLVESSASESAAATEKVE